MINKYTNKIKLYIDDNKDILNVDKGDYENNEIIKKIRDIFLESYSEKNEIKLIKKTELKKMHNYQEHPLMYVGLLDLYKKNKLSVEFNFDLNNFSEFVSWCKNNKKDMNLEKIFKNSKYYDVFFNPPPSRVYLHELLYTNMFISLDVLQHAECEDLDYYNYSENGIEIHAYCIKNDDQINTSLIYGIVSLFRKMFDMKKTLKLIVFMGNQKKFLNSSEFICSDSVNSGLSIKDEVIMIWRKEEFYKVLIHELIHYFGLDFYIFDDIYIDLEKHFKQTLNILGVDRINESYTELTALMIHSIIYSILFKQSFNDIFNYEIMFSKFQVAKIIDKMDCKDFSDILNKNIKQMTSVCSYYIVKYIFLEHFNLFLDYWKNNGFVIYDSQTAYKKLYTSIINKKVINKITMKNIIELLNKEKQYNNKFIIKNLRMTAHQI